MDKSNAELAAAQDAVVAAQVPDSDLEGSREPITVSGWYVQTTVSGRPAWRYYYWSGGRLYANPATYDRAASERLAIVAEANYSATQDYERELHSPWRDAQTAR
jgi:hypothetical protein